MEENKNIENVNGESSDVNGELSIVNDEISHDGSELSTFNNQPSTLNLQPSTEMEVHKHPHHITHKKKWTEYFLEFLMLFLAVFLGFLAENLREHQVEKERANQYIISFYEDLKYDTARMNTLMQYDEEKIVALNSIYSCYDTVSKNMKATTCMRGLIKHSKSNKGFVLTDRTLLQLANAGGYRLLSKDDADSIIAYENMYKAYLDFQTTVFQEAQDNVRNTLNRLADFSVIAPLNLSTGNFAADTASITLTKPLLLTEDWVLLNQWFNELSLYSRTINGQRNSVGQLKTKAIWLIKYYKEKYHYQ